MKLKILLTLPLLLCMSWNIVQASGSTVWFNSTGGDWNAGGNWTFGLPGPGNPAEFDGSPTTSPFDVTFSSTPSDVFGIDILNSNNDLKFNLDASPTDLTLTIINDFNVAPISTNVASVKLENGTVSVGNNLNIATASGSVGNFELLDDITVNVINNVTIGGSSSLGTGTMKIFGGGSTGADVFVDKDVFVGVVGSTGLINNKIEIHYDGKLLAEDVIVGENGEIEMFTADGVQSELIALFDVNIHGSLIGAGKISTAAESLHIENGGSIAPDHENPFDVIDDLVFEEGSNMYATFMNNDFSQINIDGDITFGVEGFGGDLHLIFDENSLPTLNTPFNVLTWTGSRDGMFQNIFEDEMSTLPSGLSFLFDYDDGGSGFLSITVVPEPSTWGLMGIGCLFIFWRVRRRS